MLLPPLFNPSNDMALAANLRQYTPPRHIQQMEADLADLARFWDEGPWGWSLATKQYYLRKGIPERDLPTDEWLAEHRRLSSREFAVAYYLRLNEELRIKNEELESVLLPCQAHFCFSLNEVQSSIFRSATIGNASWALALGSVATEASACVAQRSKNVQCSILKSPWSSSGRGNVVVREPVEKIDQLLLRRIQKTIQELGGIVVEPFYADKELDFAMEFWADGSSTRFLGYSVFSADEMGHYGGNYVESQDELLKRISLPNELLQRLIDYHQRELSRLSYRGPVGIDMMRLSDGRVHPCVEINFRRTMGLLALALYNKGITGNQLLAGNPRQGFSAQIIDGKLCLRFNIEN